MAIRFEQIQQLQQRLILSPQMQQAIRLLQLPLMDLRTLINQEMVNNPLLEEDLKEMEVQETPSEKEEEEKFQEEFEKLVAMDDEWREYFRQSGPFRKYSTEDDEKRRYFESSVTMPETLQEHLTHQLHLAPLTEEETKTGETIVGNIDGNGYLQASIEEIAQATGAEPARVERVVRVIQTFNPVGVGARDLGECLLIQLHRLGKGSSLAAKIVRQHLDDLGKKRFPAIARALRVSIPQVQRCADFIATLEPKPGRMFTTETPLYISADIFLEKVGDDYVVVVNDDRIPRLRINNLYRNLLQNGDVSTSTKQYVREKVRSGLWLVKNLRQRQQTIYKISQEIVRRQKRFLDEGISRLTPLTMQEVAAALGIHESTVSRAIANKYIQTPQGLFDLKFFFTTGLDTDTGESLSTKNVKSMISQMIKNENSKKPLRDQEIAENLARDGIKIARRTVAKYRKELRILPSNLRRQY